MVDGQPKSAEEPDDAQLLYAALKSESFRARALDALKTEGFRVDVMETVVEQTGRGLLQKLEGLAKYAVPSSLALSVAGFCICVLHYHQRGVPLSALGYSQFVAAGVLYTFLTVSAVAAGLRLGAQSRARAAGNLMVWSGMILAPLGLVSPRGSIFAVAYWAAITALVWAMTATVFWSTMSRNWTAGAPPSPKSSSLAGALTLWFISTVIFATLVFPNIPPWLGGGAPRPVSVVWDASLDREERALLVGEPNKRCLFELHSNQSDLFLVSVEPERAEACSLPRWLPEALRRRDARFPTYLVVPRSRARVVTYLPEATL